MGRLPSNFLGRGLRLSTIADKRNVASETAALSMEQASTSSHHQLRECVRNVFIELLAEMCDEAPLAEKRLQRSKYALAFRDILASMRCEYLSIDVDSFVQLELAMVSELSTIDEVTSCTPYLPALHQSTQNRLAALSVPSLPHTSAGSSLGLKNASF